MDTFVEVVAVMDIEIPSADVGDAHVVTAQLGRLHFPNDIGAGGVLESHFDGGRSHPVDTLPAESNRSIEKSIENPLNNSTEFTGRR